MTYLWPQVLRPKRASVPSKWAPAENVLSAGIKPTTYQLEALHALVEHRKVALWGPHGLGKTALGAWAVLSFAAHWDGQGDWKAVTTASVWRQLTEYLWPEIRRWAPRFKARFEVSKLKLEGATGAAFAVASDVPESIEGAHASHLLYVLDEAKLIPPGTWRAALSAMTTEDCYILAVSTPGIAGSYLHQIATGKVPHWWTRHVSLEEALAERRISKEWVEELAAEWGRDSAEFKRRVLGLWVEEDDGTLFPARALYEAASKPVGGKPLCLGVDIARGGGDLTAIAVRTDEGIAEVQTHNVANLMAATGIIASVMTKLGVPAVVDVTGLGAGVYDRLREQGMDVYPFAAAAKAASPDGIRRWANLRAQAYFAFSQAVQGGLCALPKDEDLLEELQWIKAEVASDGSLRIISKERMTKSPDRADAAMMAWAFELVKEPDFDVF